MASLSRGKKVKKELNVYKRLKVLCSLVVKAGVTEPVGTGPETVGTGPTGPDRFRFRPVPNRSKFKF
jgi:hypothetical protein